VTFIVTDRARRKILWMRHGWYIPDKRVGVQLAWDREVEVMVVLCLVIVALLPPHGGKAEFQV
jgi:hypothetical protein